MSKLAKLIDATITGDKKLKLETKYITTELQSSKVTRDFGVAQAIKVGVKFEQVIYIDEYELTVNSDAINYALKNIKRAMVEEIFGEFRTLLLEATAATYDSDMIRLRNVLAKLEQEMFYDGI